jgi:hypothetical protein
VFVPTAVAQPWDQPQGHCRCSAFDSQVRPPKSLTKAQASRLCAYILMLVQPVALCSDGYTDSCCLALLLQQYC